MVRLFEEFLREIHLRRNQGRLLESGGCLQISTGIGYRVRAHLPGAALNRVRLRTDLWKIEIRQGYTDLANPSDRIGLEAIDQIGDKIVVAGRCLQKQLGRRPDWPQGCLHSYPYISGEARRISSLIAAIGVRGKRAPDVRDSIV